MMMVSVTRADGRCDAVDAWTEVQYLEKELATVTGVDRIFVEWPEPALASITVALRDFDFDRRAEVIKIVDDFHREHVALMGVEVDVVPSRVPMGQ